MRRFAFDWHIILGRFAAAFMLVWALTGAAMTLDPIFRRCLDPKLPAGPQPEVGTARFTFPLSRLPIASARSVQLRQVSGRAWIEVEDAKGRVLAFDAATGRRAAPFLPLERLRESVNQALARSAWRPARAELVTAFDDHYRSGELPVYRAALEGPGGVVLYVSARDGTWLKTTTRWSRFFRWLGMGVHTWNLRVFKDHADDARRWWLSLIVALPVVLLAAAGYVLILLRWRARRVPAKSVAVSELRKALASALSLALIAAPLQDALSQARVPQAAPVRGRPAAPVALQLGQSAGPGAMMQVGLSPTLHSVLPRRSLSTRRRASLKARPRGLRVAASRGFRRRVGRRGGHGRQARRSVPSARPGPWKLRHPGLPASSADRRGAADRAAGHFDRALGVMGASAKVVTAVKLRPHGEAASERGST